MKVTLDHNCIINLERRTDIGARIKTVLDDPSNECFIVNVGASEMRERGVRPDRYDLFEDLLEIAGIGHLPRLNPMAIYNVTFYDSCVFCDDDTIKLAEDIESALFGSSEPIVIDNETIDSPIWRKWLNRTCDVLSLWCHIQNGNDLFLTTDGNFTKETKLPKLIALGAKRICHPRDLSGLC